MTGPANSATSEAPTAGKRVDVAEHRLPTTRSRPEPHGPRHNEDEFDLDLFRPATAAAVLLTGAKETTTVSMVMIENQGDHRMSPIIRWAVLLAKPSGATKSAGQ